MEKYICPICQAELKQDYRSERKPLHEHDFTCSMRDDNHSYSIRTVDDTMVKIKVRLQDTDDERLIFLIDYADHKLEIWTKAGQTNRVVIPVSFEPDFSDIEKLKEKIRTYLIFA